MKKIITLFASVILVASAFAQYDRNQKGYDRRNDRDVVYNDDYGRKEKHRGDSYSFTKRERDFQISKINREYNNRIDAVRTKWFMSRAKKERIIWSLEEERRNEIRKVYVRFNHPYNRADRRNDRGNW